ncbi:MAG: DUF4258 domain-containing protein [Actinomycetota bacterium]|nr:DUF4258 domain-containing protein [Actinomycetota bacterium]
MSGTCPHGDVGFPSRLVFSEHALDRLLDWDLTEEEVEAALTDGATVEEYQDSARLVLGWSGVRPIHVVVANPNLDVVTVGSFMVTPQGDLTLGGQPAAPLEWLAAGRDPAPVVDLARFLLVD